MDNSDTVAAAAGAAVDAVDAVAAVDVAVDNSVVVDYRRVVDAFGLAAAGSIVVVAVVDNPCAWSVFHLDALGIRLGLDSSLVAYSDAVVAKSENN